MLFLILLVLLLQVIVLVRVSLLLKETEMPIKTLKKKIEQELSIEPKGTVLTEADFRKFLTKKKIQEKNDRGEEVNLDDLL